MPVRTDDLNPGGSYDPNEGGVLAEAARWAARETFPLVGQADYDLRKTQDLEWFGARLVANFSRAVACLTCTGYLPEHSNLARMPLAYTTPGGRVSPCRGRAAVAAIEIRRGESSLCPRCQRDPKSNNSCTTTLRASLDGE